MTDNEPMTAAEGYAEILEGMRRLIAIMEDALAIEGDGAHSKERRDAANATFSRAHVLFERLEALAERIPTKDADA